MKFSNFFYSGAFKIGGIMKITKINSIQTFKNNQKPKVKSDNQTISNIAVSRANTNNRWFIDNCSNPSDIIYLDEIKPKIIQKPKIECEYFSISRNENKEDVFTPLTGEITIKDGKVQIFDRDKTYDFSGISRKKKNGELIQEVRYLKGYPFYITEYKDGEEYKLTHYSQHTHKINHVYYFDGSFELKQQSTPDFTAIELQTKNANGEKIAVQINAAKNKQKQASAICEVPDNDGYKTISLYWNYPNTGYLFQSGKQDAALLKYALDELKTTLENDKYKDNFGNASFVCEQLSDAINYLNNISEGF